MQLLQGLHIYINIDNFNDILAIEEKNTKTINHSLHALDTFFSLIESYGKRIYPKTFEIEKITGARLHLYIRDELDFASRAMQTIALYAYWLCDLMNNDIPKYKTLGYFRISIGAAWGRFYISKVITDDGYSEETTIGHVANYAAKLQTRATQGCICIDEDIFESLPNTVKQKCEKRTDSKIKEYGHGCYYITHLSNLQSSMTITQRDKEYAEQRANSINLKDIEYTGVRMQLDFQDLSTKQCKWMNGIPVFADIRGFTSQFAEDDSNLEVMVNKTTQILREMYRTTTVHGGVHVQFQGDRELSLYHNIPARVQNEADQVERLCYKPAVLGAMRLIDAVKPYSVHIGVGQDFGRLFATRIGARGEKDNILLGRTVIKADYMEDKNAGNDQIAITPEIYNGLLAEDKNLARQFKKDEGGNYITTIGHGEYLRAIMFNKQKGNSTNGRYNKAWGGQTV